MVAEPRLSRRPMAGGAAGFRNVLAFEAKLLAHALARRLYHFCCHAPHWRTFWSALDAADELLMPVVDRHPGAAVVFRLAFDEPVLGGAPQRNGAAQIVEDEVAAVGKDCENGVALPVGLPH